MTHIVMLNNVDHQALRVITERGARYGDNVMTCATFPAEFRDLQAHYPIVFRQIDDAAGFEPVALLGFQEGENLYLGPQGWDAGYVPLAIERLPFLIGRSGEQLNVHVDLDSPRLSRSAGEALFLAFGGVTPYLERTTSMLLHIHEGLQSTPALIAALREHDLLESFVADIALEDGSQNRLYGFHTINEDKLLHLSGTALESLNRAGHLQSIYMAMASLSNFRGLIERKQRAIAAHG
ncbi:SapC family protein [Duganella sp. CT11-25]|uniref:SapC family protein n=1 Tax=unclassified Duganella TaxID=2636909 RepID=UPI0039B0AA46